MPLRTLRMLLSHWLTGLLICRFAPKPLTLVSLAGSVNAPEEKADGAGTAAALGLGAEK